MSILSSAYHEHAHHKCSVVESNDCMSKIISMFKWFFCTYACVVCVCMWHVCVHVYVCDCIYVFPCMWPHFCMQTHMHIWVHALKAQDCYCVFLSASSPYILRQGLSLHLELAVTLVWLASWLWKSTIAASHCQDYRWVSTPTYMTFVWVLGIWSLLLHTFTYMLYPWGHLQSKFSFLCQFE